MRLIYTSDLHSYLFPTMYHIPGVSNMGHYRIMASYEKDEDTVVIDADGNVYVNEQLLEEPYISDKGLGDCDLEFPYKVPGTGYFVMGDRRSNSVDSRNSVIGAVSREDIIGRVTIRVWPLAKFGFVY